MSKEQIECPHCTGWGEVMDGSKITSRSIDPPMMECPECDGRGEIAEEQEEHYNPDRDYVQDEKEDYWEYCRERDEER